MNGDLEQLIVLQAQDLELKRMREELAAAPLRVKAAQAAQDEAESTLKKIQIELSREEALRRRQGSDADDFRARVIRLKRQLEAASSAAQITALEHEIAFGDSATHALEDEEIASLERTETLERELVAASLSLEQRSASLVSERALSAALSRRHSAAMTATEADRVTLRATIPQALLSVYDRVSKARSTGLAEALDGQCTACRMKVRPQRWNDLIGRDHEDETFTCETCGRILFYDPRRNTPGPWAAGDRLAAARASAEVRV